MRSPLTLLILFAGCGDPPVTKDGLQLKTGPYTLEASSERYHCWTRTVEKDTAVTEVVARNGALVHHVGVFQTTRPEPDGFSECPSQIKQTWLPLYGGGRATAGLKLPDGAGFKFPAGTQVLMQLHLVNAALAPVTDETAVDLLTAADPGPLVPAGIFAVGNVSFTLPVGATGYPVVGSCSAPMALNVFAPSRTCTASAVRSRSSTWAIGSSTSRRGRSAINR